jgi:uncharacterized protein YutE (UPF0331/DUF86 family)
MAKEKLTLYVDEKTSRMAHEVASTLGKSVSELVREYIVHMYQQIDSDEISPAVAKWIGAVKTRKAYKTLRDQVTQDRIRRYEDLS